MHSSFALRGRLVHGVSDRPGELELIEDGCVVVENGVIQAIAKTAEDAAALLRTHGGRVVTLDATDFCVPGFIDTHVHVFTACTTLGIPPDEYCLGRGCTTVVDAGSAGAATSDELSGGGGA